MNSFLPYFDTQHCICGEKNRMVYGAPKNIVKSVWYTMKIFFYKRKNPDYFCVWYSKSAARGTKSKFWIFGIGEGEVDRGIRNPNISGYWGQPNAKKFRNFRYGSSEDSLSKKTGFDYTPHQEPSINKSYFQSLFCLSLSLYIKVLSYPISIFFTLSTLKGV